MIFYSIQRVLEGLKVIKKISPFSATLILLACVTLLNALVAGQAGLSTGEAHYALYGRYLDWSYFDHPPMVGWLQAFFELFGHSDFVLRLCPILLNILAGLSLYQLARIFFPLESKWLAFLSVLLMQSALVINVIALTLVPQLPFILFGLWAIIFLYKAIEDEKLINFIMLGLMLGLSFLSEYTAFLLGVLTITYVLIMKPRLLLSWKLWLTALIGFTLSLPVLYWNYEHQWISFHFQTGHVLQGAGWSVWLALKSTLLQFLVYSPVIYTVGFLLLAQVRKYAKNILWLNAVIILLFFAYSSGRTFTIPHWPALAWVALIPLIAKYILEFWNKKWVRRLTKISMGYSLFMIVVAHLFLIYPKFHESIPGQPLRDIEGWNTVAQAARSEISNADSANLFVPNWVYAGRLAWYTDHSVQIIGDAPVDQFTLWYGNPKENAQGILVIPYGARAPALESNTQGTFRHCALIKTLPIITSGINVNQFELYRCDGYQA